MRLGKWIRAAVSGVPWLVVALVADPAAAQFREIHDENGSESVVEIQLTPTEQNFVPPKLEPVPGAPAEPTPAVEVKTGTPTPAEPPTASQPATAAPATAAPATIKTPTSPPAPTTLTPPTTVPPPIGQATEVTEAIAAPVVTSPTDPVATEGIQPLEPFAAFRRSSSASPADAPLPTAQAAPVAFNQVTPGVTTTAELQSQWGAPARTVEVDAGRIMIYRVPGFLQVDAFTDTAGEVVKSILVHLTEPSPVSVVEDHLQLTDLRVVEIDDGAGNELGRGYPERGVLLSYAAESNGQQASHVSLEPIGGELYRLRAEQQDHLRYSDSLADLEQATELNAQDAKAFWLQAELLSLTGRSQDAWERVQTANRLEPGNALYQLTRARLAAGNGDLTEALLFTENVAQEKANPAVVRARAQYQWGNLLALGPEPDFQEALNHHLKAIELSAKHVTDKHTEVRRMAKDILVDAHLAIAQDIALGNFQRQREVVAKWLSRATELAEEFITEDSGDETVRMEIYRTTLAVYSVLEGNFDSSVATDEAIQEGQRLVAASQDRMYQHRVERELSETLYHAAKVEHRCGRFSTALTYAENAVVLLEGEQTGVQPSLFDSIMSGQLYFLTGAIYAAQDEDHPEAIKWFEKALPTFDDERLVNLVDQSAFGDLFVSMAVSYWEAGEQEQAIELTQAGAALLQEGVQTGSVQLAALSVPYGNLAAMHQHMGNGDKAKHFATMMAKVESEADTKRR